MSPRVALYLQRYYCGVVRLAVRGSRYTKPGPSAVPKMSDRNFGALEATVCLYQTCTMNVLKILHITRHQVLLKVFERAQGPCGALRMATSLERNRSLDAAHRLVSNHNCSLVWRDRIVNIYSLRSDQVIAAVGEPCEERHGSLLPNGG
jgi:hypothetical protein